MIYYNANTFGHNIEDCAIRSISVAEGISWDEAYFKLSEYARERGLMISSVESIEEYLDERYDRFCMENMTVGEFAECFPYGTYLVTMPRSYRGYQKSETSLTRLTARIK